MGGNVASAYDPCVEAGEAAAGPVGRVEKILELPLGVPGGIQIARATWELVRDESSCEPRGTIPVKGKGKVEIWHLVGQRG